MLSSPNKGPVDFSKITVQRPFPSMTGRTQASGLLNEASRQKLDGIVVQMEANGESTEYIQSVVNDFKVKYAGQPVAPTLAKRVTERLQKGQSEAIDAMMRPGAFPAVAPFRAVARGAGAIAGAVNDVIGAGIGKGLELAGKTKIGKQVLAYPEVQAVGTALNAGANLADRGAELVGRVSPKVEQDLRDVGNVASFIPVAKVATIARAPTTASKLPGATQPLPAKANKIVTRRLGELQRLDDSYASVRKVTSKASSRGVDVKKIVSQTDLLHNAVDDAGTIRTQNAITELDDFIKPQERVISQNLQREGVRIPLKNVADSMRATVDKSGLEGAALDNAYTKVNAELAGLGRRTDADGYIMLSKVHDAKVDKYSNVDYSNPAAKKADKAIAKALKQTVETNTKSVDVATLNKELAAHYAVLNFLEKLDGKKVEGGRLGKYFGTVIGGMVGSHFGPLGTIIGAEAGARVRGAAMSTKLNGKTGVGLKQSDAMKAAVVQGNAPRLMLPAPKQPFGYGDSANYVPLRLPAKIVDEPQSKSSGSR